jgi:hypothetical protein
MKLRKPITNCEHTEASHFALGRCRRCYHQQKYLKNRTAQIERVRKRYRDHPGVTAAYRAREWARVLLQGAARSSRQRNQQPPTIDAAWIRERMAAQSGLCYWTRQPLEPSALPFHPWKPSLDRIDTTLSYTPENTVLSCWFINRARHDRSASETAEILKRLQWIAA